MIQRIQTIYLLVVAITMTIPLYVPIAQLLIPNDASYNFLLMAWFSLEKTACYKPTTGPC